MTQDSKNTATTRLSRERLCECVIELMGQGYGLRARTTGSSMVPLSYPGDMLTLEPLELCDAQTGDVIAFRANPEQSRLTVHRVVETGMLSGRPFLITMGDNQLLRDQTRAQPLTDPGLVFGRVIRVDPASNSNANSNANTQEISVADSTPHNRKSLNLRTPYQKLRGVLRAHYSVVRWHTHRAKLYLKRKIPLGANPEIQNQAQKHNQTKIHTQTQIHSQPKKQHRPEKYWKQTQEQNLKAGKQIRMMILGQCMQPLIMRGDYLTVIPAKFDEMNIGDIVAYKKDPKMGFTPHRVLGKRVIAGRPVLICRGDASCHADGPVFSEDVFGKVVAVEHRKGGKKDLTTQTRKLQAKYLARQSYVRALIISLKRNPLEFIHKAKGRFFTGHPQ